MSRVRDIADNSAVFADGISTADITEGSNLFFTNSRADARITLKMIDEDNMSSDSAAHMPTQQSVKAFVDTSVAGLVDSAPGTLDTLNELAAALGDDANFSTTVTNSIATKLPIAGGTMTGALNVNNDVYFSGQLGLGSSNATSPECQIFIAGNSTSTISDSDSLFGTNHDAFIKLENEGNTSGVETGIILRAKQTGAGVWAIYAKHTGNYTGDLIFRGRSSSSTNSEVLRLKAGGNVGIGTNNPSTKLHVDGGGSQPELRVAQNSTYYTDIGVNHIDVNGPNDLRFLMGGADKVRFKSDGKVGIGTTSPLGKLHIQSGDAGVVTPSSQADDLVVEASTEGGITIMTPDNESARIRFTSPSTESGDLGGADIFYRQNINKMSMGTTVSGGKLAFDSGADVETMVLNGGKVGIGTDDPQFKLHVNKGTNSYAPANGVDENIVGFQTSYDNAGVQILTFSNLNGNWVDGTSGADSAFGWLWGYANNVRGGMVYDHRGTERMQIFSSYGALTFMTSDSAQQTSVPTDSTMNERLTILPGGDVGIGTNNPSRKLDVQGTGNVYGRFFSINATGAGVNVKDSAEDWLIQADGGVGPGLAFYDLGRSAYRMMIDSDGHVGIGTNTPDADLHIYRGSNGNSGHMALGHSRLRRGEVGINSSQTRWYKIFNYSTGQIFSGVAQLFHNRGGGFNQTGAYRTYNISVAGYNNGIYGPVNVTGDNGESGQATLEFGTDEALYLKVVHSIYAGVVYFTFTGSGNGLGSSWAFNSSSYSTSLP